MRGWQRKLNEGRSEYRQLRDTVRQRVEGIADENGAVDPVAYREVVEDFLEDLKEVPWWAHW